MNLQQLIDDFESCLGWPYQSPGTNDRRGIDCSGMFVRAFARQGERIYHGSNTIWRQEMATRMTLRQPSDLQRGMAVFKWRPTGQPQRDEMGNFCHIGLVTSAAPRLRIVHASSLCGKVVADTRLGKWRYGGWLKAVYPCRDSVAAPAREPAAVPLPLPSSLPPTLRRNCLGDAVRQLQTLLMAKGCHVGNSGVDGFFGKDTEHALRLYQGRHGLVTDGVAGPLTWQSLLAPDSI